MCRGVMLDLETLGKKSNSVISHIGAVEFDIRTMKLGREFYTAINIESCINCGLQMDASTVLWWMQQNDEARAAFKDNGDAPDLADVLDKFAIWYPQGATLWGNGASFDNAKMADAYDACGFQEEERPWPFWNDRCYRTLKTLYSDIKCEDYGVAHNALDDAKKQAFHLMQIFDKKGLDI